MLTFVRRKKNVADLQDCVKCCGKSFFRPCQSKLASSLLAYLFSPTRGLHTPGLTPPREIALARRTDAPCMPQDEGLSLDLTGDYDTAVGLRLHIRAFSRRCADVLHLASRKQERISFNGHRPSPPCGSGIRGLTPSL